MSVKKIYWLYPRGISKQPVFLPEGITSKSTSLLIAFVLWSI